jgi:acetyltransferase-like isoleucine patch superfamily enzyme
MSKYLLKIMLFFKIDYLLNYLGNLKHLAEIRRIEKKCGCKINYVPQGFNGVKIMSVDGDLSRFKIDVTSHLKSDTIIECSGGVSIGKYFHPGKGLTIFSANHNYKDANKIPYDEIINERPVIIKDFVWIGANVTISPGVTINEGCIVASGSVVSRTVPFCAIVGGNPAEIIGSRDVDEFKKLRDEGAFY